MEEELIYLDDFFDFLEQSGIDTSLINVVDYEIDLDYLFKDDVYGIETRKLEAFINNSNKKPTTHFLYGLSFFLLKYTVNFNVFIRMI